MNWELAQQNQMNVECLGWGEGDNFRRNLLASSKAQDIEVTLEE